MKPIVIDGTEFPSLRAACKAYHIHVSTARLRNKQGMSLEDAIKIPLKNCIYSKDHLGNIFRSFSAMCAYWGVSRDMATYRLNAGWTLKKTLTTKSQRDPERWDNWNDYKYAHND